MRLKRGPVVLISGATLAAISFSMLGYYGWQLVSDIQTGDRRTAEPGGSLESTQFINATMGAYIIAIHNFEGGQASAAVRDPDGGLVLERTVDQPFVLEPFPAGSAGDYTLTLSNPTSVALEASLLIGDQEAVLNMADVGTVVTSAAFGFLLIAGIIAATAGAVITVLDRRRIGRMKQFGDTSDLV